MGFNQIHETVVADIFDTIRDGIRLTGDIVNPKTARVRNAKSLARATSGLTLTFPVICTNTLPLETVAMLAKAIERKNVAMLQMAFSAYNITSDKDALAHISKFHQNLKLDKMDLDQFMDAMETLSEDTHVYPDELRSIVEDCKRNLNYVLDSNINPVSLNEYSVYNHLGYESIIKEAHDDEREDYGVYDRTPRPKKYTGKELTDDELERDLYYNTDPNKRAEKYYDMKNRDDKLRTERIKANNAVRQALGQASKDRVDYFTKQLLPGDVKKANEMQPSLMVVNFYVNDRDRDLNVAQQFVCGVKSKIYPIDSSDIINKIITKNIDSDILLKLVKVSTREISFVKDFLLGLDDAKIDALSKSRKGSGNAIFKALERRALKGKIRRSLRLDNSAKAISTLVISSEEAEELSRYHNIDITNPRIASNIMEKLNLLYFMIVDNTAESVSMLTDGEGEFDVYSFDSLEKESGDAAYKKAINLITKVV